MEEKTLFRVALVCSITGILALLLISEYMELERTYIKDINETITGESVRIIGQVGKVNDRGSVIYADVTDETGTVTATLFDDAELKTGDTVEVNGEVSEYRGRVGVDAGTVRVVG